MATVYELSFPETEVEQIIQEGDAVRVVLARFPILISLTGSDEQTKWHQSGELVIENAELDGELPGFPATVTTGDLLNNAYTYRNEAPLPIDARGQVGCVLQFRDHPSKLVIRGDAMRLTETGERKYVQHLRAT